MAHPLAARGIGQLRDRHPLDFGHFLDVDRSDRMRIAPVREHRRHHESGHRDEEFRQLRDDLDGGGVDARPPPVPRVTPRPTAPASPGSMAPPGNAGCPAWERSVAARSISSTSGPAGPSAKSIRTAAGRPPVAGGRKRVISSALTTRAPAARRARLVRQRRRAGIGFRRAQEASSTSRRTSLRATSCSVGPSP